MKPPTSRKEVQNLMGVINYCHNMLPRWSHKLAPLPRLTYIKRKFRWTQVKQHAFNKINRIVERDNLLTYPDFNETFKIRTDAITFQLGAVISQTEKNITL